MEGRPPPPDDLRQYAMLLAQLLDPDGAEPTDAKARNRRFLTIGRLRNGVHPLRGNLLPDAAAQLQLIIDAQNNPKTDGPPEPGVSFRSESERSGDGAESGADVADADPWISDPRNVIEQRTAAQKRHDAMAAALAIAARHEDMPRLAGASPTLVVHADADDLASGTGWATVAGSQSPVPIGVATQAACTGAIQRVLFDDGRIVGTTVTDRVFTVHQRRAIIARDGECLIPGCHVPASWCEIHHVVEHARGRTDRYGQRRAPVLVASPFAEPIGVGDPDGGRYPAGPRPGMVGSRASLACSAAARDRSCVIALKRGG
ncbi:DUF222 domain-containing protein [Microbacterium oxydans]|nr:DUF222 domain-containing protein [Microbacterium oxydans]